MRAPCKIYNTLINMEFSILDMKVDEVKVLWHRRMVMLRRLRLKLYTISNVFKQGGTR